MTVLILMTVRHKKRGPDKRVPMAVFGDEHLPISRTRGNYEYRYAEGKLPAHYPVPAIRDPAGMEPLCFFCGSMNGMCKRYPQYCLYDDLKYLRL